MKCVICKTGETGESKVTVTLLLKEVPAQVCDNCGEYYLSEEISRRVLEQAESSVGHNAELEMLHFAA